MSQWIHKKMKARNSIAFISLCHGTVKIAQNFLIQLAQILEIIISQNLWTLLSHLNFGFHSQKKHHKKTFLVKTGQKIIISR